MQRVEAVTEEEADLLDKEDEKQRKRDKAKGIAVRAALLPPVKAIGPDVSWVVRPGTRKGRGKYKVATHGTPRDDGGSLTPVQFRDHVIDGSRLSEEVRRLSRSWCVVIHAFSGHRRFGDVQFEVSNRFASTTVDVWSCR